MTDELVLAYLRRRWRRRIDLSTIEQAQDALALPRSVAQRLRIHETLRAKRRLWRAIALAGAGPTSVTLTEAEKLIARAYVRGDDPSAVARQLELDDRGLRLATRVLRAVGFLNRGRVAPDVAAFQEGTGLTAHTVRVEGEPAFNVP